MQGESIRDQHGYKSVSMDDHWRQRRFLHDARLCFGQVLPRARSVIDQAFKFEKTGLVRSFLFDTFRSELKARAFAKRD